VSTIAPLTTVKIFNYRRLMGKRVSFPQRRKAIYHRSSKLTTHFYLTQSIPFEINRGTRNSRARSRKYQATFAGDQGKVKKITLYFSFTKLVRLFFFSLFPNARVISASETKFLNFLFRPRNLVSKTMEEKDEVQKNFMWPSETSRPTPLLNKLLLPQSESLAPIRRLVVLVPDAEVDENRLARAVWALARQRQLPVLFLGMCYTPSAEFVVRRRLVNLAALTRDREVLVETKFKFDQDWLRVIREFWRAGDLLVCHAELSAPAWGLGRQPLSQRLVSTLQAPVYLLHGFYPNLSQRRPDKNTSRVLLASFLTLIVFFGIQVWVDQQTTGWLNTFLLSGLVFIELGLVWFWYRHRS
jgi:hypothetical protein